MPIPVGSHAPDFTLKSKTTQDLIEVTLSHNFGRTNTVLVFFPAAFTSVCTTELCDLTSGVGDYSALSAQVFGISVDSPFAQGAWAAEAHITIPLLSDYAHAVTKAYDVEIPDLAGLGPSAARAVILIDKEGIVRYTEQTATPGDLPDFAKLKEALVALG